MPKKRYNAEEIIQKLREADVLIAQGKTVSDTCKQLGVTDQTCYRWRKEYGGMKVDQAKRLKELEAENARLKRAVVERGPGAVLPTAAKPPACPPTCWRLSADAWLSKPEWRANGKLDGGGR